MKTGIIGTSGKICFIVLCFLATAATIFSQGNRKPSLAVIEFDTRPEVSQSVGRELSDMLINALIESQRFTVVDRSKTSEIQKEQVQVLLGAVDQSTGATVGRMTGAQYLVVGSVTEFKEKKGGVAGGLGSLGIKIPKSDKIATYEATVKFNIKVINSTTGEISFAKAFEKNLKTTGLAGGGTLYGVQTGGSFESKAMQNAVEQSMQEAVKTLVDNIGTLNTQAVVNTEAPNNSTDCSRFTGANAPKVMVVIPETYLGQKVPDPAGETEIIKRLVQRGFTVVDQKQIANIRDREKVLTAIRNVQAAANLGIEFGADIIIIGEAFSEPATRQGNMVSTRARVEARAIQTDTAKIIAADGKQGSGLDVADLVSGKIALRNAGSQWADYFISQSCKAAEIDQPQTASAVEILVSNVNYAQLKEFSDTVGKISGVRSVEKKLTGNVARVSVQFSGTAENLADKITETRFNFKVSVVGLSGNKIEVSIGGQTR
jgi:curli biogenesis system outer membrane secretion channel CsgG